MSCLQSQPRGQALACWAPLANAPSRGATPSLALHTGPESGRPGRHQGLASQAGSRMSGIEALELARCSRHVGQVGALNGPLYRQFTHKCGGGRQSTAPSLRQQLPGNCTARLGVSTGSSHLHCAPGAHRASTGENGPCKGLRWRHAEEGASRRRFGGMLSADNVRSGQGRRGDRGRDVRARVVGAELGHAGSPALDVISSLGFDTLTFLAATVIIVPAFKSFKASPILGFLLSGIALNELGLIRNIDDVKALSELGILFLLFEMGLELSLERLRALAKFAFGLGLPQVVLTTLAFAAFELPPDNALGTQLLQLFFQSKPDLVNIRSVDEAIVIGAALSLSSSAFVLQLLSEKGELATKFGSATLGILLLQDIAVVPLLVILPILESGDFTDDSLFPLLAAAGLKSLLGLGVLLLMGRLFLRRFFEFVAESRSTEAFVALCLLTVTGTSLITSKLGFSDSLGAFLAGALLAETNYRTQVEADIRPFRGLLLGLFFVTTGTSIDLQLLADEWPNIVALLTGLIAIKTAILTVLGPRVGLSLADSVRTGLLLSQGGEFAFVVFALANQLGVLPLELNRLLIIVVVLSMALTPLLDLLGRKLAEVLETKAEADAYPALEGAGAGEVAPSSALEYSAESPAPRAGPPAHGASYQAAEPIVILGFNQQGQVLANFLSSPLAGVDGGDMPYVCFDLNPKRVRAAKRLGFPVLYGDGSRTSVLQSAGIPIPKAVMVVYSSRNRSVESVERLHLAFPSVPIFARAMDLAHMLELKRAGATDVVLESAETSLRLGSMLLQDLGAMRDDVVFLRGLMRDAMFRRAEETLERQRKGQQGGEEEAVHGPVIKTPPLQGFVNGSVPTREEAVAVALGAAAAAAAAAADSASSSQSQSADTSSVPPLAEGEARAAVAVTPQGKNRYLPEDSEASNGGLVYESSSDFDGGDSRRYAPRVQGTTEQSVDKVEDFSKDGQMYFSDGEDWVDPELECQGKSCRTEQDSKRVPDALPQAKAGK